MKHSVLRTGLSVLLLLALLAASLPAALGAGEGNLFVTGYRVTNSLGSPLYTVVRGSTVNITVSIKDTGDGTGNGDPKALDITKLDDSFYGGSLSVEKTSSAGAPLVYAVRLSGLTYKGVGQSLKLQVGTADQPDSYQIMELTITEAVVYEAPQPTPEPIPTPPEPIPAPNVLVSRSQLSKPIEAGQTASVTVQVKAAKDLAAASQSLSTELKFNYDNGEALTQATASDKINLSAAVPAKADASVPNVVVCSFSFGENAVAAGTSRQTRRPPSLIP